MMETPLLKFRLLAVAAGTAALLGACHSPDMRTAKMAARQGDYETARHHYESLAAFGIPEARFELAMMEMKEQGTAPDSARGMALLEEAARDDNPRALFELGKAYQEGKKVERDIPKARELLQRALALGYVRSYYQLALIADSEKDYSAAEALYRQSYATGYYKAATRIGALYKNGRGRPVDLVQALAWHYVAQDRGVTGVEKQIADFENKLGPDKVAAARSLSRELR